MNRLSSGLLAALLGGTLVAAFAPLNLWPLSFVSAAGLFWLLESHPEFCREIGWAFGIGKYGFGASWVYVSINVYGNAPPPLAAFLVLLMVLILSFFVWLQCRAYVHLRRGGWVSCALLFAAWWVLGEWLMTWMLSGFPWLYAGYAHLDGAPLKAASARVGKHLEKVMQGPKEREPRGPVTPDHLCKAFSQSKLSVKAFCEEHGLKEARFRHDYTRWRVARVVRRTRA